MKIYARFIVLSLVTAFCSVAVFGSAPADLRVEMLGPNSSFVYSAYVYRVKVANTGGRHATNVNLTVELPLSANSPTPFILGRLTNVDSRCQVVSNRLECSLGRIKRGKQKVVRFTFLIPVSTRTLEITATGTADVDANPADNSDTKILNPKYQDNIISAPVTVLNQHCTGSPSLSSFYECVLAPSSVTDHETTLNGDGSISFTVPGYTGSWSQPTNKELRFTYSSGNTVVLEFNGFAVSSTCFEGLSTFPTNTNYVSPYRVCFQ